MLRTLSCLGIGLLVASGTAYGQNATNQNQNKGTVGQAQGYIQGQIVRVDPATGAITLRDASGKEQVFQTGKTTQFYGADRAQLANGLRDAGLRPGANVMWRGQGTNLSELRLGNATGTTTTPGTINPNRTGTNPGGTTTTPGTTNPNRPGTNPGTGTTPGGTGTRPGGTGTTPGGTGTRPGGTGTTTPGTGQAPPPR